MRRWLESVQPDSLYASVLTCGAIRKGIEQLAASKRRTHLEESLEEGFREWFETRLLVIDEADANRWGLIAATARRRGTPLAIIDGLLCATALEHEIESVGDARALRTSSIRVAVREYSVPELIARPIYTRLLNTF